MKKLREFTKELSSRDPHVIFHNGKYYGCFASDGDSLSLICADTIDGLATAVPQKVYVAEKGKPYSKQLWAPELHVIDGKCYIYVACDDGNNHTHRMYRAPPMVPGKPAKRSIPFNECSRQKFTIDSIVHPA